MIRARDRAIIGGVVRVPNHRAPAAAIQDAVRPFFFQGCWASVDTSYRDNASCKSRRNTALFFSVRLKNQLNVFS